MKRFLLAVLVLPFISATLVFSIYEALQISQGDAKSLLLSSMARAYVVREGHPDLVSTARSLSTQEKVEGIRQLIQLAREYTSSEQFKADYKKWRNQELHPVAKGKLGIPKLGKILEDKISSTLDKSENEKQYPSDPVELIRKRLEDFLAISATVDFDARLTSSNMFVRREYEKKSPEWKMCYRAGKEVVEAARSEAQNWLDELNDKN